MRRCTIFLMAAALSLLQACGSGGGSDAVGPSAGNVGNAGATRTVSGIVLDQSATPVAGVQVVVFHTNDNTAVSATTGADGRYSVSGLYSGANSDYQIYAVAAGLGFYPVVTDPAGTVTRADFNGLYRTVAEFATVPGRDLAGSNFVALRAGDSLATLPRTGQSVIYAPGDDAGVQVGTRWPAVRFTDNQDGTVTDHLTGLIWLKDAGCASPTDWTSALNLANQLAQGRCGLSDGSAAGQWRMPNANELESLVDVSQAGPALTPGHPFTNVQQASAYWTSTAYTALPSSAMAIRFSDGRWINAVDSGDGSFSNTRATSANASWPVRSGAPGAIRLLATGVFAGMGGGSYGVHDDAGLALGVPLTSQRFVDKGDGTLADTVTGLTWLKSANCIHQDWAAALGSVQALADGQCGLSDGSHAGQWRVPNRTEMLSLSDRAPTIPQAAYLDGQYQASAAVTGPVVFSGFVVSDYYWTSTTDAADTTQAWAVYSCDFGAYNLTKNDVRYVLAVR